MIDTSVIELPEHNEEGKGDYLLESIDPNNINMSMSVIPQDPTQNWYMTIL